MHKLLKATMTTAKTRTKYLQLKTMKGKPYLYFRCRGMLKQLPLDQTSMEFRRAYDNCMEEAARREKPRRVARVSLVPESLGAAIDKYLESPAFAGHPKSTQKQYLRTLDQLRARLGNGRLTDLDTDAIDIHTEQVARKSGASVADRHLRLLSLIWKVCRKYPQFNVKGKSNPTVDAERRYTIKRKHRPWPRELQERFMASAPDHLKLAKLLLHFSAQRGGDCIKMKWTDFDGLGLLVRPEKTHGETAAEPNYHMCPKPLREALLTAPRTAETILVSAWGKPFGSQSTLSHAIRRELIKLGFAKPGERTFVLHGLRKTAASDVGSLGVGAAGIKTVTGHRTDGEANEYAAWADKRRVNAMVVEQWDIELERQATAARRRAQIQRVK